MLIYIYVIKTSDTLDTLFQAIRGVDYKKMRFEMTRFGRVDSVGLSAG